METCGFRDPIGKEVLAGFGCDCRNIPPIADRFGLGAMQLAELAVAFASMVLKREGSADEIVEVVGARVLAAWGTDERGDCIFQRCVLFWHGGNSAMPAAVGVLDSPARWILCEMSLVSPTVAIVGVCGELGLVSPIPLVHSRSP